MKHLFIFFALILFGFGCANQKSANTENSESIVSAEAEEWRSSPPGEDEFTEHGTDLTIKLNNKLGEVRFSHIVYNSRKSFTVSVDSTENNTLLIQGRVIYDSTLLSETSERTELADRLVFQDIDGNTDFIPIHSWTELPLSYR